VQLGGQAATDQDLGITTLWRPPVGPSARRPFFLSLILLLAACARIEPPPGGPPDREPPALLSTRPESTLTDPRFEGAVEFHFNEVISEGGSPSMGLGTSDLERLIILSPTDNVPSVSWKRSVIAVEPKEGWRPGRIYRVELLPGVFDLQRNRLDSGTVVTFSTGAPLPSIRLTGIMVDWPAGRLAQRALIEATLLPDSLRYRALTDSTGHYDFGPLPRGEYLVYGVIDENRNFRRDLRDNYDTVRVQPESATVAVRTMWAIPHDTTGPRLQSVTALDSTAVELTFNQPLDPYQQLDTTNLRVLHLPDSTPVHLASLRSRALDDSLQREIARAADSARAADTSRAAIDSARAAAEARLKQARPDARSDSTKAILAARPALSDRLIARLEGVLTPGHQYSVNASGIRSVNGVAAESRQLLSVAERPKAQVSDSLTPQAGDSARPDSVSPPPAPPPQ
jgi:hypothetical protein